jgi:hypothetical protein
MESALPILVPVLVAIIGAVAWLLRRRLTPERTRERYELAGKILDVRSKLAAAGFDDWQVEQFIATLEHDKTGEKVSSALKAIGSAVAATTEAREPDVLSTTAAMGARVDARLNVLDAKIERVILDIEILTGHNFALSGADPIRYDSDHVRKMHRAWKVYRKRAALSSSQDYAAATMSPVWYLLEEVRIAEAFLKHMTDRLKELSQ